MLGDMINTAERVYPDRPGDFVKDGKVYCGTCGKVRRASFKALGQVITPRVPCDCDKADMERAEEQSREFAESVRVRERKRDCFPEQGLRDWTFENDDNKNPTLTADMHSYVEGFAEHLKTGTGIMMYGDTGTGKTYAACEVANALLDMGYSVKFEKLSQAVNNLTRTEDRQGYIDRLCEVDLLILDDLGAERDSSFAREQVYNIIDTRYMTGKPMIITSNLDAREFRNPEQEDNKRIYDRIIERCRAVPIRGESRRKEKARELNGR